MSLFLITLLLICMRGCVAFVKTRKTQEYPAVLDLKALFIYLFFNFTIKYL